MTVHAVNLSNLQDAREAAGSRARQILDSVDTVQAQLERTDFVGENADALERQMNDKMQAFVDASYDNVNHLMRVANANMRTIVLKLGGGGPEWEYVPMTQAGQMAKAKAKKVTNEYRIDVSEMDEFAGIVSASFEEIVTSYTNFRNTLIDETPGWVGPEKDATRATVDAALPQIIGAEGGSGVRGVGSSLSQLIVDQAKAMNSTAL